MVIAIQVIALIITIYFGYSIIYMFFFAATAFIRRRVKPLLEEKQRRIAVFIPGYKEDAIIESTAKAALEQSYPDESYDVVVVADSFQQKTLDALAKLPIKVVEVSFELSTKSKALNVAMAKIGDDYDIAVVLDADNVMEYDFLVKMNESFNRGEIAVQGHRCAKNMNTNFAVLDAISEEIGNTIARKGHVAVKLSSALIGSGVGFEYKMFKEYMREIDAVGGYDKALEMAFLKDGIFIEYLDDALVYDEKVQKANAFYKQRRRWINTQSNYLSKGLGQAFYQLFAKGNIDFFNKIMQWTQPPRSLLLAFTMFITLVVLLVPDFKGTYLVQVWLLLAITCALSFAIAIPRKMYDDKMLKAVLTLPRALFMMTLALLRIRGANKKFIHTEHTFVEPESKGQKE